MAQENKRRVLLRVYLDIVKMIAFFNRILDWFKSLFWKEEMELTLVGLQYSGKTTFVNVIAVGTVRNHPRLLSLDFPVELNASVGVDHRN